VSFRKLALQSVNLPTGDGASDKRRSKTWPRLRSFVHFPVRKAKGIKLRESSVNAAMQPPSGDQRADWQTHQLEGLHWLFQPRVKSITYSLEIDLRSSCLGGFLPRFYHGLTHQPAMRRIRRRRAIAAQSAPSGVFITRETCITLPDADACVGLRHFILETAIDSVLPTELL
jgi:hypothetical protein